MSSAEHLDEDTALGLASGDLELSLREAAVAHLEACSRCRQWVSALGGESTVNADGQTLVSRPGELAAGDRLGEYEVLGRIAQGGMGAVYRGRHPVIGREVAIKVLLPAAATDPELVHRLLVEARALSAVRHPNVIDVFSFGQTPMGQHYFVMEYLEGQTLSQRLRATGPLPPLEAVGLLLQICAGLAAVHEAGVLHRDLKPANIFVTPLPDGAVHVKLLDFGLAKRKDGSGTTQNLVLGTPGHMAPEQCAGKPATQQSDLYAVGCIAFRMLTGRPVFEAVNEIEIMVLHVNTDAPRVKQLAPEVPDALDELVAQLLEREPSRRPASAQAVRRELLRLRTELERAPTRIGPIPTAATAPTRDDVDAVATARLKRVPDLTPEATTRRAPVVAKPRATRRALAAAAASVIACTAAAAFWLRGREHALPSPVPAVQPTQAPPPTVAPPPLAAQPPAAEPPAPAAPSGPAAAPAPAREPSPPKLARSPAVAQRSTDRRGPTVEQARARLHDARARAARLEAQGMRRIVETELSRLEQALADGQAPAKVLAELQQVQRDYELP